MAELRWILLLAGVVFLAGLTAWELRRPRQARRDTLGPPERSEPPLGAMHEFEADSPAARVSPSVQTEVTPFGSPLVISLDAPVEPPTLHPLPALHAIEPAAPLERADPPQSCAETAESAQRAVPDEDPLPSGMRPGEIVVPVLLAAEPVDPIVEWPPEDQRYILSVRVVGVNPQRLMGRPLRQALAACGFVHGRFGIFHQPGADGRALISAANLSKPGVFDPNSMDFQRFRGLGLFAVLPGPLPPAAALDHLLDTAGDLAERLQARLQDEHG
ncbi:MAG TPA: cell division protein ZipA C-terminal FtsZ-binding domain-containing protein, partial [Steroidobacteraceae bacterium]|nr:cell division protein ZipA C-terminal FtsZ-binding domain-containing protein [Steroidobacteraceae bacterium]